MTTTVSYIYGAWVVTVGGHVVSLPYKTRGGAHIAWIAQVSGRPIR